MATPYSPSGTRIPYDKIPALAEILRILDEHRIQIDQLPRWLHALADVTEESDGNRSSIESRSSYASSRSSYVPSRLSCVSELSEITSYSETEPTRELLSIPTKPPSIPLPDRPSQARRRHPNNTLLATQSLSRSTTPNPLDKPSPRRDNTSHCHNCDTTCGKYSDMRAHWKLCEGQRWYKCSDCDLVLIKKSDMQRHIKYGPHRGFTEVDAPCKMAFGCPHCGLYFDHDHRPQSSHQQHEMPSFQSSCIEHLIQHFKDGQTNSGDPNIRLRALLRQPYLNDVLPHVFASLGLRADHDIEQMHWKKKDAIDFARKLEFGVMPGDDLKIQFPRHVIVNLNEFIASLVDACDNKVEILSESSSRFIDATSTMAGHLFGMVRDNHAVQARTAQALRNTAPVASVQHRHLPWDDYEETIRDVGSSSALDLARSHENVVAHMASQYLRPDLHNSTTGFLEFDELYEPPDDQYPDLLNSGMDLSS